MTNGTRGNQWTRNLRISGMTKISNERVIEYDDNLGYQLGPSGIIPTVNPGSPLSFALIED